MSNININGNSTLTEVFAALDAQGIVNINQPTYFDDNDKANHDIAKFLVAQSMLKTEADKGYIFITRDDMDEWEDSRHLTIYFGAVEDGDLFDVETPLQIAIGRAGFQYVSGTKTRNSITLHVPKSRF